MLLIRFVGREEVSQFLSHGISVVFHVLIGRIFHALDQDFRVNQALVVLALLDDISEV